ncbi:unnamed protein product [Rhizoctonia solani]|uniref:Phosphatidylglycerophosphatase GEP4, mitochondrial n=1 Tax=Rhizoctonia solani TaxID=456999 RepID=A0A8H2W8H2_9AGAM|nr:unnamed protein product [Rhizoctonia solani]
MSNLRGSVFALRAFLRPGLVVPGIKVDTIARLDFTALKRAGYTGIVFDRDNCLDAWARCKSSFGRENMLLVSNSAGTKDDPLGIQAESLAYNLGVPVFRHKYKKPVCGEEILRYFSCKQAYLKPPKSVQVTSRPQGETSHSPDLNGPFDLTIDAVSTLPRSEPLAVIPPRAAQPRLVIIGDRLLTDILLATTLPSPNDHLPIWTTHLWKTPDSPLLRFIETSLLRSVLWHRNQAFRGGVVEQRAKGETWLGKEGWLWWIRRWALSAVRGETLPPEPIPPRTNPLATFILPLPAVIPWRPTTGLGWTWYYSKLVAKYVGKGSWIVLVWAWIGMRTSVSKSWALAARKIREARTKRAERAVTSAAAEIKS